MKKIAFIKIGNFSGINDLSLVMLKEQFPSHKIDVIDVWEDLARYRSLKSLFSSVKEFGLRVLWDNYASAVLRTRYSFNKVKKAVIHRLKPCDYVCTFQMTSFFDLSVPGIPHFIYTDGTNLSVFSQFRHQKSFLLPIICREIWRGLVMKNNQRWFYNIRSEISMSIIERYVHDPAKLALEKTVFHNAEMIFTMSTDVRQILIEQYGYPPEKIICVYQGSHLTPSFQNSLERYQRKNILFIGTEWERKGGPELITAFRKVRESHPDATLTIVGCSPGLKMDHCSVVGHLPLDEVGRYYEQASVFCVPSRVEAFGNVFVEALNYKLPIVATRTGALPDMVLEGENGYLVKPGNTDQLAIALIHLLERPQKCREFGERGHQIAMEKYTWEKTGAMIRRNIEKIINKS